MIGWECPKCGRVYSPFTAQCAVCPITAVTTDRIGLPPNVTNVIPNYACTCGTSVTCPLHAHTVPRMTLVS